MAIAEFVSKSQQRPPKQFFLSLLEIGETLKLHAKQNTCIYKQKAAESIKAAKSSTAVIKFVGRSKAIFSAKNAMNLTSTGKQNSLNFLHCLHFAYKLRKPFGNFPSIVITVIFLLSHKKTLRLSPLKIMGVASYEAKSYKCESLLDSLTVFEHQVV